MGTTVAQRHAKALAGAYGHICTQRARRLQQHQAEKIGSHYHQTLITLHRLNNLAIISHLTTGTRVLQQRAKGLALKLLWLGHYYFNSHRRSTSFNNLNGLRQTVGID